MIIIYLRASTMTDTVHITARLSLYPLKFPLRKCAKADRTHGHGHRLRRFSFDSSPHLCAPESSNSLSCCSSALRSYSRSDSSNNYVEKNGGANGKKKVTSSRRQRPYLPSYSTKRVLVVCWS